ncbi:Phytanoyl-CoA dioxygenase (PhyH) [Thalassoglobus polymorphus]|uniref:Phytanoyl-CoA dioxygenase (PhyH) n=2 Tax=Thalassoglobus polymorphus TaxID=2527994 RepID=A0A517QLZ1_9PLAN|nr:Phytanoyl-CoA dioxygenase (PhyH) [Thalassoglobus polymorphus]
MNLAPKLRPLWQRMIIVPALGMLLVYKALHLPSSILPRDIRSIVTNWHYAQFWMLIKSGLTRTYIDEPCKFRMPEKVAAKAEVAPEFQFTEEQLRSFYENGFIGPIDAFSPEEMKEFRNEMLAVEDEVSPTYGFKTPRDPHFDMPKIWEYMKSPAITERVAQLLGPDLLVWRSQHFYKGPGAASIQWHQASTFMVEDYLDPAIFPKNLDEMYQLTVWVAVDDSTYENGCIEFIKGSHEQIRTIKFGGEEGFYKANFTLEHDYPEDRVVKVPVKAGQFIIFTERCIHGSGPNTTDRHRLAFNMRVIPTDVAVYTDKEKYRSVYNGGKYSLKNWGVSLLRGEDKHQLSRVRQPAELQPVEQRKVA